LLGFRLKFYVEPPDVFGPDNEPIINGAVVFTFSLFMLANGFLTVGGFDEEYYFGGFS